MTKIVKHLCDSCGAALKIDREKQMLICPFCGIYYDYEYFRDDDVHERLRQAIEKEEFNAAREVAEFIIAKDPHDFEALQGLFMASCSVSSLSKVVNDEFIETITVDKDTLDHIVELASDEDKEYFIKCRDFAIKCDEYIKLKSAGKKADNELKRVTGKRNELLDSKAARTSSAITFVICVVIGILALIHQKLELFIVPYYWLFLVGSAFVFWININYKEKERIKEIDNAVNDRQNKSDAYDNRLDDLRRELRMLQHDIKKKSTF